MKWVNKRGTEYYVDDTGRVCGRVEFGGYFGDGNYTAWGEVSCWGTFISESAAKKAVEQHHMPSVSVR